MFELFTERARKAVLYSREEAEKSMTPTINTEHLLLGVIREDSEIVMSILRDHKINVNSMLSELKSVPHNEDVIEPKGALPFSALAKLALERSSYESKRIGSKLIGPEHILLGLASVRDGKASEVLYRYGFDLVTLREEIINYSKYKKTATPESTTPLLNEFGKNLTQLAEEGKIDKVIGRQDEIDRVIRVLGRRSKHNVVLVGEAGVGKTAIVEGLAVKIATGQVPEILTNKKIISIELGHLVAGTKYRGQFEERVKNIMKEVEQNPNIIVFIDEIHSIIGAGAAEGAVDASNMLKPALARGQFQCIGATTYDEYKNYIEKDAALARRFQKIVIEEPMVEDTISIIKGIKKHYEDHHKVLIPDGVIVKAVELTTRYIADKYQPDKTLDIIDEACSHRKIIDSQNVELEEINSEILALQNKKELLLASGEYELDEINREIAELEERREIEKNSSVLENSNGWSTLEMDEVYFTIAMHSGIPESIIKNNDFDKIRNIKQKFDESILGQEEAKNKLSLAIKRSYAGLQDANKPLGSFIFLGPTGVGKTEVAKRMAEELFGSKDKIIRIDMGEFLENFNATKLIGAPPGYVGYEKGGALTEKVRKNPYSIVLFDEVEKAHPNILNTLLQVLDDGHLTDSKGRKVSFKNTFIIFTSNLGTRNAVEHKNVGFTKKDLLNQIDYEEFQSAAMKELQQHFAPEFLNRIDDIVVFKPLNVDELKQIIKMQVAEINKKLAPSNKTITVDDKVMDYILSEENYNFKYGARPIKRKLQEYIENNLSEMFVDGTIDKTTKSEFTATIKDGKVVLV